MMRIGLDIDNTVLDYSEAFRESASKFCGLLLPIGSSKTQIKKEVVDTFGSSAWTQLQGLVYSEAPSGVEVSKGFRDFLERAREASAEVTYVSHKTKIPIVGPKKDIRTPIKDFMLKEQLFDQIDIEKALHFCDSLSEKIEKIKSLDFDIFVDDLLEVVHRLSGHCRVVHYGCNCQGQTIEPHIGLRDWTRIGDICFG
jgi:hypothetical protein